MNKQNVNAKDNVENCFKVSIIPAVNRARISKTLHYHARTIKPFLRISLTFLY